MIYRDCSHSESVSIMRILSACAEADIRAEPMLLAWSKSQRKAQSMRINRIANDLSQGSDLDEVLRNTHAAVCDEHAVAIRFGNRLRILPQLTSAILGHSPSLSWRYRAMIGYILIVLATFLCVIGFLAMKIFPMYEQIIHDFGADSPASFQWAVALSPYLIVVTMCLPLVFLFALSLIVSRRMRRWLVRPFQFRERLAAVLELLGVAMSEGVSIDKAASELSVCLSDPDIKKRLLRVAEDSDALSSTGFLTPDELEQCKTLSDPTYQGRFLLLLAAQRCERIRRIWAVRFEILIPVLVAIMGILVLVESQAILEPLTQLIQGLS